VVGAEPLKALLLLLALQVLLNGVAVLVVEVEKPHQPITEVVVVLFLAGAVVALADQLWLVFLNAVLAVGLQHTLVINV
jgi:hypothetical protein